MPPPSDNDPKPIAARVRELTVPAEMRATALEDFLLRAWPDADRLALRRSIDAGSVQVNFEPAAPTTRLRAGDYVRIELPADGVAKRARVAEPALADRLQVLVETAFCLIVAKPAGEPSVPDRAGKQLGVYGALAELRPDDDLRIAHRLDRDTSGCLAIARGLDGARWLDHCFRGGLVGKYYLALVEGRVAQDSFEIRRALGPDRRRPGLVTVVEDGAKRSRAAETGVEVAERFRDHTLLKLTPRTGRGHQLRAHLSSVGHPIVADVHYGARGPLLLSDIKRSYKQRPGVVEQPLLRRMFLHCERLEVPVPPAAAETVIARAPLPDDLERALDKLRKFAAVGRSTGADDRGTECN